MARKIGNTLIIENGPTTICELCGKVDELRPYGPGGKWICFGCGNKDDASRAARDAAFDSIIDGPGETGH